MRWLAIHLPDLPLEVYTRALKVETPLAVSQRGKVERPGRLTVFSIGVSSQANSSPEAAMISNDWSAERLIARPLIGSACTNRSCMAFGLPNR